MRVTGRMINQNLLYNLQNNMQRLAKTQQQISTGKRILRPSDDPSAISLLMESKAVLEVNKQYVKNIDDGLSYLYTTDTALDSVGKILQDAHELAVQGSNGTLEEDDMKAIGEQIDKMIDHLVDVANTSVGGKYIFAGRKNDQPPFIRHGDKIYYRGGIIRDRAADAFDPNNDDDGRVAREIAAQALYHVDAAGVTKLESGANPGVFGQFDDSVKYDINGDGTGDAYMVQGGLFDVLFELRNNLNNGDTEAVNTSLGKVQDQLDHVLRHRVGIGARTRHFESAKEQLMDQEINVTQYMQNIEDADIARISIDLTQQELTYEASLAASAKIMQTSLLNFLR
ncbi:MAG: flagellar hook-associated protein FlgL [Desulfotomaculum sp.]|nr:flagellar hook-associated protein FlgL [Desulfotomaculum sp.]